MVKQSKQRSGWPIKKTLEVLAISRSTYQRWVKPKPWENPPLRCSPGRMYKLLAGERRAIIDYALKHPEIRHRELAWRMLDENICATSAATVYRVLGQEGLVCRWQPKTKVKGQGRGDKPTHPDEKWQTDIKYVQVGQRNCYLISFMDVYSRYIVNHRLLRCMDGQSMSTEAAAALAKLDSDCRPDIQSDHGSGFIAREFAETLGEFGVTHKKIRPHTPTDNAEIERYHRTIGGKLDEHDLSDFIQAQDTIDGIIEQYNHHRLHAALSYLRPVDYYRGNPEVLLAQRRRKLQQARELRKQENLRLRQHMIPWPQECKTVA